MSAIMESVEKTGRVDSRLLSPITDLRHRTILENIDRYHADFNDIDFLLMASDQGKPLPQGGFGKPTRYAMLTEDQCLFLLCLLRNNKKVVAAKLELTKAFMKSRKSISKTDKDRLEIESANVTRMTNSLLGIESGHRDSLDANQLKQVAILEGVVDIAIRDGVKAEMPYKDIYQLAKERAAHVVRAIGVIGGDV